MTRALALFLLLVACATFPEVDAVATKPGLETPALLPTDQLAGLATAPMPMDDPLAARTAALRARAQALRDQP